MERDFYQLFVYMVQASWKAILDAILYWGNYPTLPVNVFALLSLHMCTCIFVCVCRPLSVCVLLFVYASACMYEYMCTCVIERWYD